ncbi:MAG: flagellar basal body P-ring formation chaperone FlgA [Burkholderiaceae bacterium]|nr:flagellar basal body P-ring formation chaperone FlgA [Burkholderiaceae bacterium]
MFQIRPQSTSTARHLALGGLFALIATAAVAQAGAGLGSDVLQRVQQIATQGVAAGLPAQARVEVEVGKLDPRLRLAPCAQVQPYLPAGLQMWGATRIGLRCVEGPSRWNVSLPVRIKVYARAIVAADPLASGVVLTQAQLATAEIDIAAEPGAVFTDGAALVGRALLRPLAAGEAVRNNVLKQRQVFAAGDRVTVLASGPGYSVAGEGQALGVGLEGQNVKIKFENGRVVTGRAIAERRVEVLL